jgi:hypothetical protein
VPVAERFPLRLVRSPLGAAHGNASMIAENRTTPEATSMWIVRAGNH